MKFTLEQLRQTKAGRDPKNEALIAEAIGKYGPKADIHTLGSVRNPQLQRDEIRPLDDKPPPHKKIARRVVIVITIIRFGAKEFDEDNFIAGAKPIRDAIARSLGVDDADRRIRWEYRQVLKAGRLGTLVKIDEV